MNHKKPKSKYVESSIQIGELGLSSTDYSLDELLLMLKEILQDEVFKTYLFNFKKTKILGINRDSYFG